MDINKVFVPEYEFDTESDTDSEEFVAKKKTRVSLEWELLNKFNNYKEAEKFVTTEGIWSLHYCHVTEEGKKKYYRCNKVKRHGPQCSARIYLLCENTSDSVFLFKTNSEHDHDTKKEFASTYGLTDNLKNEINRLFELKLKPKAIMQSLMKMENVQVPKMSQLRNYLNDCRRAVYGQSTISLGELEAWILSHSNVPLDPHEVFVVCHQIDATNEKDPTFRFLLSTKYLIEISKSTTVIHADATYKIIWQGFPVLVCGTTDKNLKFHPVCLTVSKNEHKEDFKFMFEGLRDKIHEIFASSWNPKVLVCDAAKSIQDAFFEVFGPDVVVRMCWAHAKRKIQEKVKRLKNKVLQSKILNDVDTLHCITHKDKFDAASNAFLKKYEEQAEFVSYFKTEWLLLNRNWFLGAAPDSPSTNNALESFHRIIKDSYTFRERFPLSRFLVVAKEMVHQWSFKYTNQNENSIGSTPSLTIKNWTEAYQWAKKPKEVIVLQTDETCNYFQIPGGQLTKCEISNTQWESFDNCKKNIFSKWVVSLPIEKDKWREGRCDCPAFFKFYICKHVIGMAIRLKYAVPPLEAKYIPVGEKRKRGRPSKAKQALIIQ